MAGMRFSEQLLASAADLAKQARHFRAAVEKGDDADHLRKDFQTMADSFDKLARPPERLQNSLSVDRAIGRVDAILADISRQLKTAGTAVNEQPSSAPQPAPGSSQEPSPPQPVIPEEAKGIALLPLADQAAALAQRTCPITKDPLGAHGKPLKVQIRDRAVFVCCEGCVDALKANPG